VPITIDVYTINLETKLNRVSFPFCIQLSCFKWSSIDRNPSPSRQYKHHNDIKTCKDVQHVQDQLVWPVSRQAKAKGYQFEQKDDLWHFQSSQFDPHSKSRLNCILKFEWPSKFCSMAVMKISTINQLSRLEQDFSSKLHYTANHLFSQRSFLRTIVPKNFDEHIETWMELPRVLRNSDFDYTETHGTAKPFPKRMYNIIDSIFILKL